MKPYWQQDGNKIYQGDVLDVLKSVPDESIQMCVTSPPYWGLRSYLPDVVKPKPNTPISVIKELKTLGIFPIDNTVD